MVNKKSRILIIATVLIVVFIGLGNLDSFEYNGRIVYESEKPPLVAAIFQLDNDRLEQDVLYDLLENEDANIVLNPIQENMSNSYLYLKWNKQVNKISIFMRKIGNENASFEIWAPKNRMIASGELSNDFKLYEFELTEEDMIFEDYALFNYGPAKIKIDKILGDELPESKSEKLIGILAESFV